MRTDLCKIDRMLHLSPFATRWGKTTAFTLSIAAEDKLADIRILEAAAHTFAHIQLIHNRPGCRVGWSPIESIDVCDPDAPKGQLQRFRIPQKETR
jgi:hypothetical protein